MRGSGEAADAGLWIGAEAQSLSPLVEPGRSYRWSSRSARAAR